MDFIDLRDFNWFRLIFVDFMDSRGRKFGSLWQPVVACGGLWQRVAAPKGRSQAPILQVWKLGGLDPGGLQAWRLVGLLADLCPLWPGTGPGQGQAGSGSQVRVPAFNWIMKTVFCLCEFMKYFKTIYYDRNKKYETRQDIARHCKTLQDIARHCKTLKNSKIYFYFFLNVMHLTLERHCKTLQDIEKPLSIREIYFFHFFAKCLALDPWKTMQNNVSQRSSCKTCWKTETKNIFLLVLVSLGTMSCIWEGDRHVCKLSCMVPMQDILQKNIKNLDFLQKSQKHIIRIVCVLNRNIKIIHIA